MNIIILNSYDGAVHTSTNTANRSVLLYSTQLVHRYFFGKKIITSSSSNILTRQQVISDENLSTVFPVMESIFEQQQLLQAY